MSRIAIPVVFAIAAIFALVITPPRSAAQDGTPAASPAAENLLTRLGNCNSNSPDPRKADVRPPDRADAHVIPVITDHRSEGNPTLRPPLQEELYLVVITL